MNSTVILAQQPAQPPPGQPTGGGGTGTGMPLLVQLMPFLLILLVLYFVMLRPNQRKEKQRQDMLSSLKRGDRIQTIGGVLGTVVEARESEVVVKVDEGNNTKIRFSRSAIHKVVEEEKAEGK